jgi:hypothetical protein
MGLAEQLAVRRVRDLAVDRHHVAACVAEGLQRLAVRLAGGYLVAQLEARTLTAGGREAVRLDLLGRRERDGQIAGAAQLLDRGVGLVERLAVLVR